MVASKKQELLSTAAAAEALGLSSAQFSRIVKQLGVIPDDFYTNPHYRSGPPASLWSRKTVSHLKRRKAVKEAQARKGGHAPKDYTSQFLKKYDSPRAALADACEALFNLNRYTRHSTCSRDNREEILRLKSELITMLYHAEVFTDRVEKLTNELPKKGCYRCDGLGCERCDDTGKWSEARQVASYAFTFTVDDRRYSWMEPDFAIDFVPTVEETRADDGTRGPLDKALNIPKSRLAEAKALVRFALRARGDLAADPDD